MTLTLGRADKKNALSNAMLDGLERAEKDPAACVVLFQGDGDGFAAGNDLADFAAQANGKDIGGSQTHRFISNLGSAVRPFVAAVQGDGREDSRAARFGSSPRRSRASLLADPRGYVGSALLFLHRLLNAATRPDR